MLDAAGQLNMGNSVLKLAAMRTHKGYVVYVVKYYTVYHYLLMYPMGRLSCNN